MNLASGARVDRYLILRGLGAFHRQDTPYRTFLALDTGTTEDVILQVAEGEPRELQTFLQNYQKARTHSSAHLPTILAGGMDGECAYLSTARVPGVDLHRLTRNNPLEPEPASQFFWIMTLALSSLHGNRLAHGDVRPQNVIVTPGGEIQLVGYMPAPFNVADSRVPEEAKVRRYAAPEVLAGEAPTPRSDLYSLGLVALEVFCGRPILPHATRSGAQKAQASLQLALDRVVELARGVPPMVRMVLHELLQQDPAGRPRDASMVIEMLLKAMPRPADIRKLPEQLADPLKAATRRAQKRALEAIREEVANGEGLEAAASLLLTSELTPRAGDRYRERLANELRRALWLSLLVPEDESGVAEALPLLLNLAAGHLEETLLGTLALVRLGHVAREDSPFRVLLPSPELLKSTRSQRKDYIRRLREAPDDEEALLGLAIRSPRFKPQPKSNLVRLQADLLEHHKLYRMALACRAQDVLGDLDPRQVLDDVRRLTDLALEEFESGPGEESTPEAPVAETGAVVGESLLEIHLSEPKRPPAAADEPPPEQTGPSEPALRRVRDIDPTDSVITAGPEVLFTRGQILVYEGKLGEAAEIFTRLMKTGLLEEERYYSAICSELRKLMWKALVPGKEGAPAHETMWKIWELARDLELTGFLPLCEGMLLASLPQGERGQLLEELIQLSPRSIPFLQAASTHARESGDLATWARHLVTAGWRFIEERDLVAASKVLMAAKSVEESGTADQALVAMFEAGDELASTALAFREHIEGSSQVGDEIALQAVEDFLDAHPNFQPAQERALELASRLDMPERVTQGVLELAKKALRREDHGLARRYFHFVLGTEYENDEALLYLASYSGKLGELKGDVDEIRIELLRREELFHAAMHHAHRKLQGGQEDDRFHRILIRLCEEADEDPSPHYLRSGLLALERKDLSEARQLLEKAMLSSEDLAGVLDVLMETPGVDTIFSPMELARKRAALDPPVADPMSLI